MDWQFKVGLGIAALFGLLPFAVKTMPPGVTWSGIAAGILFIIWGLFPEHDKLPFWPTLLALICASGLVGNVFWGVEKFGSSKQPPPISFQKLAMFWVNVDADVYQLGVVPKFFNADDKPYLLKGLTFTGVGWSLFPRGSYIIRSILQNQDHASVLEDNYIKAGSEAYFQKLLPIKFSMILNHGDMPDFILRGEWQTLFGDKKLQLAPNLYAVMTRPISQKEWDDLRKPQSSIDVESMHFKLIPPEPQKDAPDQFYLLYNRDRSATVDNPYFAQTLMAKSNNGALVFVVGKGPPPLDNGWIVLGRTYGEVWADPKRLAIYNSIYPPNELGQPQAFGFFAGAENVMAGQVDRPVSAPTTRAADILDFRWR